MKNKVVIAKYDRGYRVSKEYPNSYYLIIKYLETKFYSGKTNIANSRDDKEDGNTKYRNIPGQFFGSYSKLETAENHCTKYYLMGLLLIAEYINRNSNNPYLKWDVNKLNIFKHCTELDFQK